MEFECHFNGHCQIDVKTRRVCPFCRLMKCFQVGMQKEMIRSSRLITIRKDPVAIQSKDQCPTLNLSILTLDQWNFISNLPQYYDESVGLAMGENYIREQLNLPLKLRFKGASIIQLWQMAFQGAQSLYQKNEDFLSLSFQDRSLLLKNTLKYTSCLAANFMICKVRIVNYPAYYDSLAMIIHPQVIPATKRIVHRFDFDMIMIKLLLVILSFSTTNLIVDPTSSLENFSNTKEILRIQDNYIDIAWRYLIYKCGFPGAVKCCSDLMRCVFAVNEILVQTHNVQWISDMFDSLIQQTKQNLSFNH